ncbi:glycosyltransferase family 4 protein [Flavisolibacter ginsenosidimutans]|uniref:Glycosyltransferase family 4 protein n=1 Tax=Flavisolibacter ginsenosidimutans TaxID=661481 RepID=A0A5B8UKW7_9BACT|nr:glycosyltransferase family 4 protein [Flavisolibacter ginsenosidimutans]QEC57324.1 glycosyltransferase family 4 protein [Flavisolibacter ginsenosidimutans]
MKLAFILSRCTNLGPFIVARDLVRHLLPKVTAIDVFYLRESGEKLLFAVEPQKIRFNEKINFNAYDLVHSHGFVADAYVYFHTRHKGVKTVTTLHQRIAPDYAMKYNAAVGYLFERFWCSMIQSSSAVVTLTGLLADYYKKRLRRNDISFIYNGIEHPRPSGKLDPGDEKKIKILKDRYKLIGISARLIHLKGIDQVIKALSVTNEFALVVVGDGIKKEELMAEAKSLTVDDRCLFVGYQKNAVDYFPFFDLYAMSSRSEGFGLCVVEAAANKIPVVCSDLPVYRELFQNGEVVRYELEDISSLAQALRQAIANQKSLSEKIYQTYTHQFTAEQMACRYLAVYQKILNQ